MIWMGLKKNRNKKKIRPIKILGMIGALIIFLNL